MRCGHLPKQIVDEGLGLGLSGTYVTDTQLLTLGGGGNCRLHDCLSTALARPLDHSSGGDVGARALNGRTAAGPEPQGQADGREAQRGQAVRMAKGVLGDRRSPSRYADPEPVHDRKGPGPERLCCEGAGNMEGGRGAEGAARAGGQEKATGHLGVCATRHTPRMCGGDGVLVVGIAARRGPAHPPCGAPRPHARPAERRTQKTGTHAGRREEAARDPPRHAGGGQEACGSRPGMCCAESRQVHHRQAGPGAALQLQPGR